MKRIDERDVIFSRMGYSQGSYEYEDYYRRNPDKKAIDDELREMGGLTDKDSPTYNEMIVPAVNANFMFLSKIMQFCDEKPAEQKIETDPIEVSRIIKNMALHYGAASVGITRAKDEFFYSHRGRH